MNAPTAPHVTWPSGTTWLMVWTVLFRCPKCKTWCVPGKDGRRAFVSNKYAAHAAKMARLEIAQAQAQQRARLEIAQAQAQQRARRIERARRRRHEDGPVRYGPNADERHVARNLELFTKEI